MVQIFIPFLHHTLQQLLSWNYIDSEASFVWKIYMSSATNKRITGIAKSGISVLSYLEMVRIVEFWCKFIKHM
jgi:hypothetical protein